MKLSTLFFLVVLFTLIGKLTTKKTSARSRGKPSPVDALDESENSERPSPPTRSEIHGRPVNRNTRDARDIREYRLNRTRFWVEVLTLLAVAFYAAVAYQQWGQMIESTQQARKAADAATSAAKTAEETLKTSKESFQIEQRPYLVTEIPVFNELGADKKVRATVFFKNIGRTPAVRVSTQINLLRYRPSNKSTADFVNFLEGAFADLRKKMLGGGKFQKLASTAENPTPLSVAEIPEIQKADLTLFYIGISKYYDFSGGIYETEFCYFYFGSDPKTWHICDSHNTIK